MEKDNAIEAVVSVVVTEKKNVDFVWVALKASFGPELFFRTLRTERNELPADGSTYSLLVKVLKSNFDRLQNAILAGAWYRSNDALVLISNSLFYCNLSSFCSIYCYLSAVPVCKSIVAD